MSKFKKARAAAEATWLQSLKDMKIDSRNLDYFKNMFAKMSDDKFRTFIDMIRDQGYIPVYQPNLTPERPDIDHLIDLCEKLGEKVYHHLTLTDFNDPSFEMETPKKYLVTWGTIRRQIQTLENKISIPDGSDTIDQLSGQVVGSDKGSSLSGTEAGILNSKDMTDCILEFVNPRGGNVEAYQQLESMIINNGYADLEDIVTEGRPTAVESLDTFLISAQVKSNI